MILLSEQWRPKVRVFIFELVVNIDRVGCDIIVVMTVIHPILLLMSRLPPNGNEEYDSDVEKGNTVAGASSSSLDANE